MTTVIIANRLDGVNRQPFVFQTLSIRLPYIARAGAADEHELRAGEGPPARSRVLPARQDGVAG